MSPAVDDELNMPLAQLSGENLELTDSMHFTSSFTRELGKCHLFNY